MLGFSPCKSRECHPYPAGPFSAACSPPAGGFSKGRPAFQPRRNPTIKNPRIAYAAKPRSSPHHQPTTSDKPTFQERAGGMIGSSDPLSPTARDWEHPRFGWERAEGSVPSANYCKLPFDRGSHEDKLSSWPPADRISAIPLHLTSKHSC